MKIGAQLYTVREFTQTIDGVRRTFEKVRKIGYSAVQISGFGRVDPKEVAKIVADSGLTVACTHMAWPRFRNELDAVIAENKMWKCSHPAIGGLFDKEYISHKCVQRFIDELTPIAQRLAAAGMDFSYHNHSYELARIGKKTWLQEVYEQGSPRDLKAEIDVYWIAHGGGDPAAWLEMCAGRIPVIHFKDMVIVDGEQRMAEIGEGNLNWPKIIEASVRGGAEYALVEQDDCYGKDPFECLATSYRNLREMGLS